MLIYLLKMSLINQLILPLTSGYLFQSLRFSFVFSFVCVCLGSDRTVFPSRCFPDETTGVDLRCLCSHSRLPATTRPPNRKMSPPVLRHRPLPFLTPGPQNRHRCSRREHHTPLLYLSGTPTTRPYLSHCHARSNGQSGATAARSQRPS